MKMKKHARSALYCVGKHTENQFMTIPGLCVVVSHRVSSAWLAAKDAYVVLLPIV